MSTVITVENLSKYYRLGLIGGRTLHEDLSRGWAKFRGKPDTLLKIGQTDHGNRKDDQIWALKDINFEVEQGEILGIIGRNGAGKSTLLKILSKITAPTEGKITIRGRVGSLLEVGTGFHPELTGRENIYLNGAILGMTKIEVTSKLDEIVEFAEMAKFIDTPVKRYSSGMTVRLAFAVAAHLEPEIMIIDEVLAVGDVAFQKKCLGKMQDISGHGRTVLFVSHNMASIQSLCSRAVLLESGAISMEGNPASIISEYLKSSHQTKNAVTFDESTNRQGDGTARFVSILGGEGESGCDTFLVEHNSTLYIKVCIRAYRKIDRANVALTFFDSIGMRLIDVNLSKLGKIFSARAGAETTVEFKIDNLQLSAGLYNVSLWMGIGGVTTFDSINSALTFTAVKNDGINCSEVFPGPYSPMFTCDTNTVLAGD